MRQRSARKVLAPQPENPVCRCALWSANGSVTLSQTRISIKVFIPDCPMSRQRVACASTAFLAADENSVLNEVRDVALRRVLR